MVLLRGADGVFSTGADMNNAYGWYGEEARAKSVTARRQARPRSAGPASVGD